MRYMCTWQTVAVIAAAIGFWWQGLKWVRQRRIAEYMRKHPNTILLNDNNPSPCPSFWMQLVKNLFSVIWKLLFIFVAATFATLFQVLKWTKHCLWSGLVFITSSAQSCLDILKMKLNSKQKPTSFPIDVNSSTSFVLAPILKASTASYPSLTATSRTRAQSGKGVAFESTVDGHARLTTISYGSHAESSAPLYSGLDNKSRTPAHRNDHNTNDATLQSQSAIAKGRIPHTPPLRRRHRSSFYNSESMEDKENNVGVSSGNSNPSGVAAVAIATNSMPSFHRSIPIVPAPLTPSSQKHSLFSPHPALSSLAMNSNRKYRVSTNSQAGNAQLSPEVKNMYERLRLPIQTRTHHDSQLNTHYASLLLAQKRKRNRENERLVWEAFSKPGPATKKPAIESLVSTTPAIETTSAHSFTIPCGGSDGTTNSNSDVNKSFSNASSQRLPVVQGGSLPANSTTPVENNSVGTNAVSTPAFQFGSSNTQEQRYEPNRPTGFQFDAPSVTTTDASTPAFQSGLSSSAPIEGSNSKEPAATCVFQFGSSGQGATTNSSIAGLIDDAFVVSTPDAASIAPASQTFFQFGSSAVVPPSITPTPASLYQFGSANSAHQPKGSELSSQTTQTAAQPAFQFGQTPSNQNVHDAGVDVNGSASQLGSTTTVAATKSDIASCGTEQAQLTSSIQSASSGLLGLQNSAPPFSFSAPPDTSTGFFSTPMSTSKATFAPASEPTFRFGTANNNTVPSESEASVTASSSASSTQFGFTANPSLSFPTMAPVFPPQNQSQFGSVPVSDGFNHVRSLGSSVRSTPRTKARFMQRRRR